MIFLEVGKIEGFWRELLLALCKPVYQLIVYLYELFEAVATAEIITNENLTTIYNRVGLLLGMYMMFRIIFSFIQMLINPDYITDKEKGIGNIAKKAILVVVLLGITPFIFNKAIELQNFIVGVETKDNVIAKLIFPKEIIGSEKFGAVLSASLFDSFYRYDDDYDPNKATENSECYIKPYGEADGGTLYSHIANTNGNINAAKACLDNTWKPDEDRGELRYSIAFTQNGLFALVVGLVVCYMLLNYTLMVGARVIQLAFLRLIAPMAILGYLSPKKDGMFEKWLKMCTTTYIDLFIRMAILFFVVFMIDAIIGGENGIALAKPFEHIWMVNIVMILALLIFGKKAPELLKELFPKGGAASLGYGLKSPKKLLDDMAGGKQLWNATKRTAGFGMGALAGGAIGFLGGRGAGRISGLFGGIGRGALSGAKKGGLWSNLKGVGTKQAQVNKQKIDWKNNGSTWSGRMSQRMANTFGYAGTAEQYENKMSEFDIGVKGKNGKIKEFGLNQLNAQSSALKEISGAVSKMEERATSKLDSEYFEKGTFQGNLQQRRNNYKALSTAMLNGDSTAAWSAIKDETNRVNSKLIELKNNGITSGAEYDKVNKEWMQINEIGNSMRHGTYSASDAESDKNSVIKNTMEEYVSGALQGEFSDVVITDQVTHIKHVTELKDNEGAFGDENSEIYKLKESLDSFTTYDQFDNFSKKAKGANTELSEKIYKLQTEKEAFSKSEAKKAADADRSAVGGHSGGKK